MSLNATLLGQMITFAVFVWFTMKFVWPPITRAMAEREKKIADGLAAAERGHRDLELAQHKSIEILQEAKLQASQIIDQANKRGVRIIEEAKESARQESENIINSAKLEIEQQKQQAKEELRRQVSDLAVAVAEKIIEREIDEKSHQKLLNNLVAELQ